MKKGTKSIIGQLDKRIYVKNKGKVLPRQKSENLDDLTQIKRG